MDVNGLIARAQALTGHNELARALTDYDAALAMNQGPYARLCRGLLHRTLGNLEQARSDIEPWLKLDPNWAKVIAELDQQIAAKSGP
jgi:tetratricopeptide (TPR) repeat protein